MKTNKPLKRKTPLRSKTPRKTKGATLHRKTKKNVLKSKPGANKRKTKRLSPRLGINDNAKEAKYRGIRSTCRYKGIKGMAWTLCSHYIRMRDNYTCVTCGNATKEAQQAGHYWPIGFVGSNNKLSWDEMNIHCQCKSCNENAGGLQKVMSEYIANKYGQDLVEELDQRRWKTDPIDNWEDVVIYYETKLEELDPNFFPKPKPWG